MGGGEGGGGVEPPLDPQLRLEGSAVAQGIEFLTRD